MYQSVFSRGVIFGLAAFAAAVVLSFPNGSSLDQFGHYLSDQINVGFQVMAHLLMFYVAYRLRSWRPFQLDLAVTGITTIIVQGSKKLLTAPWAMRPSGTADGFPSGHASATFSLAFLLSIYYPRWWWVWYGMAALVSWSRVQTNAHTLLQIAVGMSVGLVAAYGISLWMLREGRNCAQQE